MAGIISSGIGSGLDIQGIVQQLVAAEGQPVEVRIAQKEARAQAKLSAFGSLKSALSDFRSKLESMKSIDKFLSRTATSGNEDAFTVSAGSTAQPASYTIEVVQLAQAQKLTSGAFVDAEGAVGTGTLTLAVGGATFSVAITDENSSLSGIRDAINLSNDNTGIAATIVNADSGSYLILTSDKTGVAQNITVTQTGGDGGLSAIEYDPVNSLTSLTESIAAQDGLIRVDGFDVQSSSNTFEGAVQGVTINALASTDGELELLSVSNDSTAARELVDQFVESYNALVSTFDSLTQYNAEADLAAPLLGDATIRGIRDQVRRELSSAVSDIDAPFKTLRAIGLEVQLDGKIEVNDSEISAILEEDFVKFGQIFSNPDGYATRLYDLTDGFLKSDGILDARTSGLTSQVEDLSDDRLELNERLANLETRLLRQFNALDSLLAELSSTSNFLAQQLSALPGVSRPGAS